MEDLATVLDVEHIAEHLYTKGQPDPDLVIRTSGEQRLSDSSSGRAPIRSSTSARPTGQTSAGWTSCAPFAPTRPASVASGAERRNPPAACGSHMVGRPACRQLGRPPAHRRKSGRASGATEPRSSGPQRGATTSHLRARHLRAALRPAGAAALRRARGGDPARRDHRARAKRAHPELGYFARAGAADARRLPRRQRSPRRAVPLTSEGGTLRVELNHPTPRGCRPASARRQRHDDPCGRAQPGRRGSRVTVVSKDLPMRVKASDRWGSSPTSTSPAGGRGLHRVRRARGQHRRWSTSSTRRRGSTSSRRPATCC